MFGYLEAIGKDWNRPKVTAEDLSTTVPERIGCKTKRKLASHLIEDEAESTSCSNHTSLVDSGSESDGDDSIITPARPTPKALHLVVHTFGNRCKPLVQSSSITMLICNEHKQYTAITLPKKTTL